MLTKLFGKRTDAKAAKDGQLKKPAMTESTGVSGPVAYYPFMFSGKGQDFSKKADQSAGPAVDQIAAVPITDESSDALIQKLIIENPEMNVATFYNLLKSKGIKFDQPTVVESDSSSSFPQALRDGVKKESGISFRSLRFLERTTGGPVADKTVGFTRFKVALIQEGMGNFKDAYYYSRQALESAVTAFEGKKIYADHPSMIDESSRPERTVRDILGHFEDLKIEESEDGRAMLVGDVVILSDPSYSWARALMGHALEYSKKYPNSDFIGVSINASGDANPMPIAEVMKSAPKSTQPKIQEAIDQGIEQLNVVSVINSAVSCDMVTEAGAAGKILNLIENSKNIGEKMAEEKKVESKEQEAKMKQQEDGEAAPADAAASHADEQQDVELIKKMIKKYMGDDVDASEEECGAVKEAMEAFKDMGHSEEECEEKAVSALKLAKHMAAKKEKAAKPEGEEVEQVDSEESEEKCESDKKEEAHKEAMIKLHAENAKLKETLAKKEVGEHLEKLCRESKLSRKATDGFKAAVGTPKTLDEVNRAWKLYEAAFASGAAGRADLSDVYVAAEKQTAMPTGSSLFDGIVK